MMGLQENLFCAILVAMSLFGHAVTSRGVYRISDPTNIQLPLYDETELTCEMNISPDKFQWRFYPLEKSQISDPNAPLDLNRKNYIELPQSNTSEKKKSTLIVKLTNSSMAGDYQCLAHYGASILASIPDRITITTLKDFPPQDTARVTVTAGNTVLWRCEPPYSNPPAYIDYSKDGTYVPQMSGTPTTSLILQNVTRKDSGVYKCKATNTLQEKKEESMTSLHLNVVNSGQYESPRFIIKPNLLYTAKRGDQVFLECGAVGTPVPRVIWMKRNGQLQTHRTKMIPGGLIISNIVPEDEGVYVCNYTNAAGTISQSITLMYNEPANVIEGPRPTTINEGERLELECAVRGTPEPQVSWLLNGKSVMSDDQIQAMGNKISFLPIEKRHAGILQCFAVNALGVIYRSADLTVIPKQISSTDITEDSYTSQPKNHKGRKHKKQHKHKGTSQMIPPRKPTISRLNDESVVVRWNVSTNDGLPIQFFKVQYKELGPSNRNVSDRGSRWKTANSDIAPNIRSFEINNLKPDHIYRFRIAAVYSNNDNKLSQKSERFHLEKEEFNSKNPLPTPTLTHTETINATSIQIFWESIPNPNITVDGYFINYMPASSAGDYMRVTVDGEKTSSFVITHLQQDTVYDIKMQSFNTKTASEFSHILKEKTEKMTTESPKVVTTTKTKDMTEPGSNMYIFIGVGVVVLCLVVSIVVAFIICTKWKKDKDTDSERGDRDKPNDGINHHIQAEGNDYVVTPKNITRNNGCPLPSNRITITANPLADADNKSQNMIEMSCLSSQNNNCAPSASTQEVQHPEPSLAIKGKHKKETRRPKHGADPPSGENYV